jgi:Ser/Thr protein kinase RdoA (MazF antagonist)
VARLRAVDVTQLAGDILADSYGVRPVDVRGLHAGMRTTNLVASVAGGERLFVKVYGPETDLAAVRAAIEATRYAHAAGVPTALPVPDSDAAVIHVASGAALSVWTFVEGDTGDTVALDAPRMSSLGEVLGRLHHALAGHPRAWGHREDWCDPDWAGEAITAMIDRMRHARHLDGAVRRWGIDVLRWRMSRLSQVADILDSLPAPPLQVIHGDLNPANIIFAGDRVAALIDFDPPVVRPVWWEIARTACSPSAVLYDDHFVERVGCLLSAYRLRNPALPAGILAAVLRVARCFMTASLTPFDDLVDPRAAVVAPQDPRSVSALTRYAVARHEAVVRLWRDADSDDRALRQLLS